MDRKTSNMDDFFFVMKIRQSLSSSIVGCKESLLWYKKWPITSFEKISNARLRKPTTTSIVLDGALLSKCWNLLYARYSENMHTKIFIPYVCTRYQFSSRLGRMCDTCFADSFRPSPRAKHGIGVCGCGYRSSHAPKLAELSPSRHQRDTSLSESPFQWFNYQLANNVSSMIMIPK
jgi:hypothetical protein